MNMVWTAIAMVLGSGVVVTLALGVARVAHAEAWVRRLSSIVPPSFAWAFAVAGVGVLVAALGTFLGIIPVAFFGSSVPAWLFVGLCSGLTALGLGSVERPVRAEAKASATPAKQAA